MNFSQVDLLHKVKNQSATITDKEFKDVTKEYRSKLFDVTVEITKEDSE